MDSENISRKKVAIVGLVFLAVIAVPISVYTVMQNQDTRTKAAVDDENIVVAVINGKQITKAQVRLVAQEQNDPSAVDDQALKTALEVLAEREILDKTATSLGITPDQQRVNKYTLQEFTDKDAKYEALREQIILKEVKSREAMSVGFWNPPPGGGSAAALSTEEQAVAASELTIGTAALCDIESGIKAGDTVLEVGESILTDNQALENVLAVNGFILSKLTPDQKEIAKFPQIYEFGDSGLDNETRDALFATPINQSVITKDTEANRGGVVFKVTATGKDTGPVTYIEWLNQQKVSLFQDLNVL